MCVHPSFCQSQLYSYGQDFCCHSALESHLKLSLLPSLTSQESCPHQPMLLGTLHFSASTPPRPLYHLLCDCIVMVDYFCFQSFYCSSASSHRWGHSSHSQYLGGFYRGFRGRWCQAKNVQIVVTIFHDRNQMVEISGYFKQNQDKSFIHKN